MNHPSVLHFTGAPFDRVISAYALGNGYRLFFPSLMRFTAPDESSPFDEGGINAYVYCGDDPVNASDPSGHAPIFTAMRDALGAKLIDAIGARLSQKVAARATEDTATARAPEDDLHDAAPGPSNKRIGAQKRKAYQPGRETHAHAPKAPRMQEDVQEIARPIPRAVPRALENYVVQAESDVRANQREVLTQWRLRNPGIMVQSISDTRRLTEFRIATLLAQDGRVFAPEQRGELAVRLGYRSNRYDWLRSRLTGREIVSNADTPALRTLLNTLFGRQWTDSHLT